MKAPFGDRTWCESSPTPQADMGAGNCSNSECPRWLNPEEGSLLIKNPHYPVVFAKFRDGEFCPGYNPIHIEEVV